MKKITKILSACALAAALFTSCNDPVFYGVLQDVESETATVSGTIAQISRYTVGTEEYLLVNADGGLRYKKADARSHGAWSSYNHLPFSLKTYDYYGSGHKGEQLIKVVTDDQYIYIVTCSYADDSSAGRVIPDKISLWAGKVTDWSSGSGWQRVICDSVDNPQEKTLKVLMSETSGTKYYYSAFNVFSTNSVKQANRKAFIRSGQAGAESTYGDLKYFTLNGTSTPIEGLNLVTDYSTVELSDYYSDNTKNPTVSGYDINSVVYFGSGYKFFCSNASTTNETTAEAATKYYFGKGSSIYYYDGVAGSDTYTTHYGLDASYTVSSLAVCSDALLIGRGSFSTSGSSSGGIAKTTMTNGVPGSGLVDFDTNAESQISKGYIVYSLLNTNPAEAEKDSALYAAIGFASTGSSSSVSYSDVGLWSYYPGRGNWNRE